MISGVRASSIRMESTSSTIAKVWPRWTVAVERRRHVVAQVVEAELGVRAVRDVGRVGVAPLVRRHHVPDRGRAHPERLVHRAHPLGVALGEVVVHRDEVDVRAGQRVQVEGHRGNERLALTGLHLGDVALVEDDRAHHLDVERAQSEGALRRLADGRVGLEDELAHVLPVLEPLAELDRLAGELLVAQALEVGLERRDVRGLLGKPLEAAPLAHAQNLFESTVVRSHPSPG